MPAKFSAIRKQEIQPYLWWISNNCAVVPYIWVRFGEVDKLNFVNVTSQGLITFFRPISVITQDCSNPLI